MIHLIGLLSLLLASVLFVTTSTPNILSYLFFFENYYGINFSYLETAYQHSLIFSVVIGTIVAIRKGAHVVTFTGVFSTLFLIAVMANISVIAVPSRNFVQAIIPIGNLLANIGMVFSCLGVYMWGAKYIKYPSVIVIAVGIPTTLLTNNLASVVVQNHPLIATNIGVLISLFALVALWDYDKRNTSMSRYDQTLDQHAKPSIATNNALVACWHLLKGYCGHLVLIFILGLATVHAQYFYPIFESRLHQYFTVYITLAFSAGMLAFVILTIMTARTTKRNRIHDFFSNIAFAWIWIAIGVLVNGFAVNILLLITANVLMGLGVGHLMFRLTRPLITALRYRHRLLGMTFALGAFFAAMITDYRLLGYYSDKYVKLSFIVIFALVLLAAVCHLIWLYLRDHQLKQFKAHSSHS